MSTIIRKVLPSDAESIRAFNARLAQTGITFALPAGPDKLLQRRSGTESPYQSEYIFIQDSVVRGGYILKHEQMFAGPGGFDVGNYQLPLSEGIIDRRYAMVGLQLIRHALVSQQRLYCLGMGSIARPLPQLLKRLGWSIVQVPFYFRIEHAWAFAREMRWLRQKPAMRWALDVARFSGLLAGAVAMTRLQRRLRRARLEDVELCEIAELPDAIDGIFDAVRGDYGLLCDRRSAAMQGKLPRDSRLSNWLLYRRGSLRGWVVLSHSQLHGHLQFGNMSLGSIVDGLAAPADVDALISAACARLRALGCDLLVSNQSHPAWMAALRRHGFFSGPSNFVLALSPALVAARGAGAVMHFNRGDGDGPINL